jgi:hypothetical protein
MTKDALCETHIRMWPRELFEGTEAESKTMLARKLEAVHPLNQSGVYVLYRDDVPFYIGQAKNLRKRLWQHAWNPESRHFNFWNFFTAFVIKDKKHMNQLEAILITAMPTANGARPKIQKEKLPAAVVDRIRDIRRSRANQRPA